MPTNLTFPSSLKGYNRFIFILYQVHGNSTSVTRVGKHSGEALTCTAFSVKSQRLLFTLFYCGLVRSLYKWPVDSSALSWESLIEHLINCLRYIFQAQDRDKHTRYDELEPELKFLGSKWNSQAHGGDAANMWSQGNTPPSSSHTITYAWGRGWVFDPLISSLSPYPLLLLDLPLINSSPRGE